MLVVPESKLAELKAQYPRAQLVKLDSGDTVVMRPPTRPEWKKFQSMLNNEATKLDSQEWLFRTMVVFPDVEAIMSELDDRPGLPASFSGVMAEMSGISTGGHEKKAL